MHNLRLFGAPPASQRGVVLPIVLVVLMVVTMLVVTQVRRGAVDERLAGNWNRSLSGHGAAEALLRYCEAYVLAQPDDQLRVWHRDARKSNDFAPLPVWRSSALTAADYITVANDLLPPNATAARCVVENADAELADFNEQQNNMMGVSGMRDRNAWKFRFTMIVTYADSTPFGSVTYMAQSEVRKWIE